jgi:hypothetical protein
VVWGSYQLAIPNVDGGIISPNGMYIQYEIAASSGVDITSVTLYGIRAVNGSFNSIPVEISGVVIGG